MLALFRYGDEVFCAVITVEDRNITAHGARSINCSRSVPVLAQEAYFDKEINADYGESSTFELPFGTAIHPIPVGTVLPWEK